MARFKGNHMQWLHYLRSRKLRDIVGPVNRQTVELARRDVWAQNSSQEAFIGKHMGKKLEPLTFFSNLDKYRRDKAAASV